MQSLAQLIRTRRRPHATTNTFQLLYHIFWLHACYQTAYSLQVSIASIPDFHITNNALLYGKKHIGAARAVSLVMILYNLGSPIFILYVISVH